jgi:hypothetical protein
MITHINKYVTAAGLPIFLLLIFIYSSCATSSVNTETDSKNPGWIDDNTFFVTTIGKPVGKYDNVKERRNSARRAAVINAQFRILKKFKKMNSAETGRPAVSPAVRASQAAKINSIIKSGKIQSEKFDKSDNCEIIYKVRYKNLKKFVSEADLSSIDVIN